MADINPLNTIKTLLSTNWNSTNTDSITPTFAKKYELPKNYRLEANKDLIYIYSISTNLSPSGIGSSTYANVQESVNIDIRSRPTSANLVSDSHARKVLHEVKRILKANINDPDSNFRILSQDISHDDTSNNNVGIFRYVLSINLIAYHRQII